MSSLPSFIAATETEVLLDSFLSRLDILGDQTATFGTSGITRWRVAEDGRLWRTRPIAMSFVSPYVVQIGVSKCQAPNVPTFET
jgi:hypothetical protein